MFGLGTLKASEYLDVFHSGIIWGFITEAGLITLIDEIWDRGSM